ncbi:MAG: hypothetical protein V2A78_07685 [bacterium]
MKKIYLEKRIKEIAPWLFDTSFKWTRALETFFSTFSPQIHKSLELSLSHPSSKIGFIVGDTGEAFGSSIEKYLLAIKAPASSIEKLRSVNALFPGVGILFKAGFYLKDSPSASIYYQFPLPLKMTARLAGMLGLKQFPSPIFQEIGVLLMKKGVYPGLDFKADAPPALALYYPVRRAHSEILPALQAIVERLRMGSGQKERLAQIHTALSAVAEGCLYVSFAFNGKLLQSLKLDYEYMRVEQALETLKNLGISSEEIKMVGDSARVLERSALNYVGVKFEGTSKAAFQYYFIRSARETFPDNLEQIRWIPD